MPRISELRNLVKNEYLGNGIISGREAKELVKTVAGDALSTRGVQQLQKLRQEFRDDFSAAGLREFDKAYARASANLPAPSGEVGSGGTVMDVRLGRNLDKIPTAFKLSEVEDPDVKAALKRFDVNIDGRVDEKDRDRMGFSDDQWRTFIFSCLLMGTELESGDAVPTDLRGKTVCLTAVEDYQKAKGWAEAMGARVISKVSPDLDFLVVGGKHASGKDERAHILNTLGEAEVTVTDYNAFRSAANRAGVVGGRPNTIGRDAFTAEMESTIHGWYDGYVREMYDDELSYADTAPERERLREAMRADLASFSCELDAPNEATADWIDDRYANNEPYLDNNGVPIPLDDLEITAFYFSPEIAGIGLSKDWVFDRVTGERVDDFEVQD